VVVRGSRSDISDRNKAAWKGAGTLRWFARYQGWSDPGEEAAIGLIAEEVHDKRILDIGVGAGRTVPFLRSLSLDYQAIDFTEPMLELCHQRYPDVRAEWGDARHLDAFADGSFDLAVFSWNGIDAVDHADRALILAEVHRILAPGGLFLFSSHNECGPGCGEKPWTIHGRDFRHPKHLADLALSFPLNLRNHLRHRGEQVTGDGWSVRNAAAHHFGLVIHYTTLEQELVELAANGFEPIAVLESEHGRQVGPGDDTSPAWWLHFVARRTVDATPASP